MARNHARIRALLVLLLLIDVTKAWNTGIKRRQWLQEGCAVPSSLLIGITSSKAEDRFISSGTSRTEYTNSITASRDTNISPKEVYDTLGRVRGSGTRALDVGAGAGVSTQVLYDMGFTTIDACDWSSDAWDLNVVQNGNCPESVHFYQLDDERFVRQWKTSNGEQYDAIVFNFAINQRKAVQFATELLNKDGVLLAPVNSQDDYCECCAVYPRQVLICLSDSHFMFALPLLSGLKQTYKLMDSNGKILWSAADVGAWSVQFQPDVTQDTCQGIWCPPYNGFRKQQ